MCSDSFGNPSGFSLSAMAVSIYIALDIIKSNTDTTIERRNTVTMDESQRFIRKSQGESEQPWWKQVLIISSAFLYAGLVSILEVCQKVNYIGQVLFGLALGLWVGLFFFYVVRDPLYKHAIRVLKLDEASSLKVYFCISFFICLVAMALVASVSSIAYTKATQSFDEYQIKWFNCFIYENKIDTKEN